MTCELVMIRPCFASTTKPLPENAEPSSKTASMVTTPGERRRYSWVASRPPAGVRGSDTGLVETESGGGVATCSVVVPPPSQPPAPATASAATAPTTPQPTSSAPERIVEGMPRSVGRTARKSAAEPVAHAAHGVDVDRLAGVRLELLAQVAHVHVDGARVAVVRRLPHGLEQALAREHPPR